MKTGTRVMVISHVDDNSKKVYVFGLGTYIGEQIPEESCGIFGTLCKIAREANPAVKLDSGPTIYGCECWWLEEPTAVQMISAYVGKDYQTINVSIEEERKMWRESEGERIEKEARELYASIKNIVPKERQRFKDDMSEAENNR